MNAAANDIQNREFALRMNAVIVSVDVEIAFYLCVFCFVILTGEANSHLVCSGTGVPISCCFGRVLRCCCMGVQERTDCIGVRS